MSNQVQRVSGLAAAVVVCLATTSFLHAAQLERDEPISIVVLSSRPDMVSGGDALIEVSVPKGAGGNARVLVDGRDVTPAFHQRSSVSLVGLVDGLRVGRNVLRVVAGRLAAQLELTNYPSTGPILSGPPLTPFVCMTEQAGLGPPLDEHCSAKTKTEYFYRTQAAEFKSLPDPAGALPTDLTVTTTRDGRTVPYIVRVESGTINRAIYRIAILDEPNPARENAWLPGAGWNHRLIATFGGGCDTKYNQGVNTPMTVLSDLVLSRGFAYMTSTQNVNGQHCNDALSGEALMMLKEHFIEHYGVPVWTSGIGASGGAMHQLLIAQNFPGLLDGLLPSRAFPDHISVWSDVSDCRLFLRYFSAAGHAWTEAQKRAVEGNTAGTCESWETANIDTIVATYAKGCGVPDALIYDPIRNPRGARCTVWDTNVNSYGRDATGAARRTLDNVGVEYGRQAFLRKAISAAQFIDLNRQIGGFDNDGTVRGARTIGDAEAIRLAYATGRVNSVGGSLRNVPILQYRAYLESKGNLHDRVRDFAIRERLLQSAGRADNQVIWINPDGPMTAKVEALALDTMSQWLDALARDSSGDAAALKIVRARPPQAVDACWDQDGNRIEEPFVLNAPSRCDTLYPSHANPRMAAGGPLAGDILKCQLKPLRRSDYQGVAFTDAEWREMIGVFPGGVCDYSKPGINQRGIAGTFQSLPLAAVRSQQSKR